MRPILNIALAIALAGFLAQCTERIDVEVDSTYTRLVVEGHITTDTLAHAVKLSLSGDYFANKPADRVSDATVMIDDGDQTIQLTESKTEPGLYLTEDDYHGIPGKTYTLLISQVDVDADGEYEVYTARSVLHPVAPLDSIGLELMESPHFKFYQVLVYAWDPPETNFYAFKVYKNYKLITDTLNELVVQNDEFFNGNYTYGIPSQFLDQDEEEEILEDGDVVTFELNGITEEFYQYVIEAQSEVFYQTPMFSGPPANIKSNISNGALGFFTAYSIERSSIVFTEE
jgi:hypothetical protein